VSIHVEMTNPVLTRVSRDDQAGELVLEFRHHSDTLLLVWHLPPGFKTGSYAYSKVESSLAIVQEVGSGILRSGDRNPEWVLPRPVARRRRPSRALDRAGLTESGPRPITSKS